MANRSGTIKTPSHPLTNDPNLNDFDVLVSWYRKQNVNINQFGTGVDNLRQYIIKPDPEQSAANLYAICDIINTSATGEVMGFLSALKGSDKAKGELQTYADLFNWVLSAMGLSISNIVNPFLEFVTSTIGIIKRNQSQHKASDLMPPSFAPGKGKGYRMGSVLYFSGGEPKDIVEFLQFGRVPPYNMLSHQNEKFLKQALSAMNNRRPFIATIMKSTRFTDYKDLGKHAKEGELIAKLSGNPALQADTYTSLYQTYIKIIMTCCGYLAITVSDNISPNYEVAEFFGGANELTATKIANFIRFGGHKFKYSGGQGQEEVKAFAGGGINAEYKKLYSEFKNLGFEFVTPRFNGPKFAFHDLMDWWPVEFVEDFSDDKPRELKKRIEEDQKQHEALEKLAGLAIPYEQAARAGTQTAREEFRKSVYQCILLSAMPWLQKLSGGLRTGRNSQGDKIIRPFTDAGGKAMDKMNYYENLPIPYGGRIIPINVDPYQNTMNALNLPPVQFYEEAGINQYINAGGMIINDLGTRVSISKVVKNFTGLDGKLVNNGNEVKLPLNFSFAEIVDTKDGTKLGKNLYIKSERKSIQNGPLYRENIVLIKSIQVEFKGGNMATAKSDVEVKMKFYLPDITHLDYTFKDRVKIGDDTYSYKYSFLDLLTYTNNNKPTGFASVFRGQYHPDYNRLLLESYVYYETKGTSVPEDGPFIDKMLRQTPLVLDIAVVDHEIKKDSKTNAAEITVSYRGYVDSAMTDPSIDALAGPSTMKNRIDREEVVQEKLAKGCDIDEIREQIRLNAQVSTTENIDTLSRIVNKLAESNRIYQVGMKDTDVRSSFALSNDKIAKPWKILDPLEKADIDQEIHAQGFHNYIKLHKIIEGSHPKSEEEFKNYLKYYPTKVLFPEKTKVMESVTDYYTKYWLLGKNAGTLKKKANITQKEKLFDLQYTKIKFFYFGDLIDVIMDGIHEKSDDDKMGVRTEADKMLLRKSKNGGYYFNPDPLKVILTSFKWYLPTEKGQYKPYTTNLADVPISFDWFSEWYRQEVIEKKLQYYSLNGFINALAQTVITRILGDICFNVGAEHKTLFRATTDIGLFSNDPKEFASNRKGNLSGLGERYYAELKNATTKIDNGCLSFNYHSADKEEYPLLKKVPDDGTLGLNSIQRSSYCSYLIVYPANASSYEFQAKTNNYSQHDAGIPEFKFKKKVTEFTSNGFMHNGANGLIESMDFSKQDAPYRREVKFFASNMGNLAQISGVYSVKITLSKAAYFLFPGQLIWVDAGVNGDSNNIKSMAFVLGLGGYYQIVSVNHNISYGGGVSANSKTEIEATWVSYGLPGKHGKHNYYKSSLIPNPKGPKQACNSTLPKGVPNVLESIKKGAAWLKKRAQALKQQKQLELDKKKAEQQKQNQQQKNKPPAPKASIPQKGTAIPMSFTFNSGQISVDRSHTYVDFSPKETSEVPVGCINPATNGIAQSKSKYKLYPVQVAIHAGPAMAELDKLGVSKGQSDVGPAYKVLAFYTEDAKLAFVCTTNTTSGYLLQVDLSIINDIEDTATATVPAPAGTGGGSSGGGT